AAAGDLGGVIGRPADRRGDWINMGRTSSGWKLDRTGAVAALVVIHVEDAPWRNAVVRRVMDDVKSGRLGGTEAVADALILHSPVNPAAAKADRSTPEGAIVALFDAMEKADEAVVADSFRYMRESDDGAARKE